METFASGQLRELLPPTYAPPPPPHGSRQWRLELARAACQYNTVLPEYIGSGDPIHVDFENCTVVALPEHRTPAGSHHNHDAAKLIHITRGILRQGDIFCDVTSGSFGVALAYHAARKNQQTHFIVGDHSTIPNSRVWPITLFGGNTYRVSGTIATASAQLIEVRNKLFDSGWVKIQGSKQYPGILVLGHKSSKERIVFPFHADNHVGPEAFEPIGAKLVGLGVDAIVSSIGSFVTTKGFRDGADAAPGGKRVPLYGCEDAAYAPNHAELHPEDHIADPPTPQAHTSYGLSAPGIVPKYRNLSFFKDIVTVSKHERIEMRHRHAICREIGNSSLNALVAAEKIAPQLPSRQSNKPLIGVMFYDGAERY